ncbi:MAG: hypothetical protein LBT34_03085, partial [Clostridiales Family XIII bacterium]|nr:hypothetical protein [Clostridiales Family XIII bacterium]
ALTVQKVARKRAGSLCFPRKNKEYCGNTGGAFTKRFGAVPEGMTAVPLSMFEYPRKFSAIWLSDNRLQRDAEDVYV